MTNERPLLSTSYSPDAYRIDPDIQSAATLPGTFYTDGAAFEHSKETVFARSWQLIGDTTIARTPGDYQPLVLLSGMLNEPILLTRDSDDTLHCLSNVCTHRAHLVAPCAGHGKSLRCRYHGRKFNLDGTFSSMPEFSDAKDFPSDHDNLSKISLEQLGNFLFTSLDPAFPFEEALAPILERVKWMPFTEARLDESRSRDYLVNCHWALYCENYLEGFHIPFVHRSLNEALEYGQYATELFPQVSLQVGISKGGDDCFDIPEGHPDFGHNIAAYYFFLFPNTMLNFYPWGVSVNVVRPLSLNRTKVSFLSYVWDESLLAHGAGAELDRVEREDEEVVENVQLGVSSRLYKRGRFSPTAEKGVHHFQTLLLEALKK